MQILYDDQNVKRSGSSYRLILIAGSWHVVANGYLCRVKDQEEGRQVIERQTIVQPVQEAQPHKHAD